MVPGFDQTTRALGADRGVARALVVAGLVLALAWGLWMGAGRITLTEVAAAGRVEALGVARLRAPAGGSVRAVPVRLGEPVAKGALLLALDATEAELAVATAAARVAALEAQLGARAEERSATGARQDAAEAAQSAQRAAAQAALAEARVLRDAARAQAEAVAALVASGAASPAQVAAAAAEQAAAEARVGAAAAELRRATGEVSVQREAGSAQRAQERQTDEALRAELAAARAALHQAEDQRDRRTLRAPIAGRVGELAPLVPGQVIVENSLVSVIVPDSELQVEARFAPERAAGRLVPGQAARVRIVGAGGQGARAAVVREVGSEPGDDGRVRVVLGFATPAAAEGLHHGLVAEVEVEVEAVAPYTLLLRAAGQGG